MEPDNSHWCQRKVSFTKSFYTCIKHLVLAFELFKCVIKTLDVPQLGINDEIQSNASDVPTQFLAELHVYTTVARYRNIAAFCAWCSSTWTDAPYARSLAAATPHEGKEDRLPVFHNQLVAGLTAVCEGDNSTGLRPPSQQYRGCSNLSSLPSRHPSQRMLRDEGL